MLVEAYLNEKSAEAAIIALYSHQRRQSRNRLVEWATFRRGPLTDNVPPRVTRNSVGREQPIRHSSALENLSSLRSRWSLSAHRTSRHTKSDVSRTRHLGSW